MRHAAPPSCVAPSAPYCFLDSMARRVPPALHLLRQAHSDQMAAVLHRRQFSPLCRVASRVPLRLVRGGRPRRGTRCRGVQDVWRGRLQVDTRGGVCYTLPPPLLCSYLFLEPCEQARPTAFMHYFLLSAFVVVGLPLSLPRHWAGGERSEQTPSLHNPTACSSPPSPRPPDFLLVPHNHLSLLHSGSGRGPLSSPHSTRRRPSLAQQRVAVGTRQEGGGLPAPPSPPTPLVSLQDMAAEGCSKQKRQRHYGRAWGTVCSVVGHDDGTAVLEERAGIADRTGRVAGSRASHRRALRRGGGMSSTARRSVWKFSRSHAVTPDSLS